MPAEKCHQRWQKQTGTINFQKYVAEAVKNDADKKPRFLPRLAVTPDNQREREN